MSSIVKIQQKEAEIELQNGYVGIFMGSIPQVKIKKKRGPKKTILPEPKGKHLEGHWTQEQTFSYHMFLEVYSQYFLITEMRRLQKVFRIMSNFIKTRSPTQCRSHHQKMQKKYKSFLLLIKGLRMRHFSVTNHERIIHQLQLKQIDYDSESILTEEKLQALLLREQQGVALKAETQLHIKLQNKSQ